MITLTEEEARAIYPWIRAACKEFGLHNGNLTDAAISALCKISPEMKNYLRDLEAKAYAANNTKGRDTFTISRANLDHVGASCLALANRRPPKFKISIKREHSEAS